MAVVRTSSYFGGLNDLNLDRRFCCRVSIQALMSLDGAFGRVIQTTRLETVVPTRAQMLLDEFGMAVKMTRLETSPC